MGRTDKVKADAQLVEDDLRLVGDHFNADRIARLRKGYASAISTLKALHSDNMALRKQLGLPSFLSEYTPTPKEPKP